MNDAALQHKNLTLMFTDIVGYSRLMGRDQAQTISMLEDYRRILVEQIAKHQGTVIEFIGDAVFARFDSAQSAVNAGIGIQKELFTFNHFRDKSLPRLQTRIGLHCGEVATKGEAVFGDDVNIAARLEPIAVADGICVSHAVYEAVKDELKEPVLKLGVQPLKNIESKIKAYLIRPLGITFKTRLHYANRKLNQKLGAYRYPIAAALVMVIISLIYWVPRWLVPGYDANYVEIADFKNLMNAGGEVDYLSGGITEAVRSQLADVRDVYLVKSGEGILAPIILEGSVQKIGDNLRIAYQLMRRDGNVQIAGGKLDGAYEDIFILQDRVTAEIAKYLAEEFGLPNFRPAKIDLTSDVLAYEFYMRGLEWLNKPSSEEFMDEAIKFFTTSLVHDDEFALANAGLCQAFWKKYQLTEIIEQLKRAESYCNLAINAEPGLYKAAESMGIIYMQTGRYKLAEDILKRILNADPTNVRAATILSETYGMQSRFSEAKDLLNKVKKLAPKNWLVFDALGRLYWRQNNNEMAISEYKKVLKITPENSVTLTNLGVSYYMIGDLQQAALHFERSVELQPSGWGFSNAGLVYYYSGNFAKAEEMLKQAIKLSPEDSMVYMNLADVQRVNGASQEEVEKNYYMAIKLANKKLEFNPESVEAQHDLIKSYTQLGNYDKAREIISYSLKETPNNLDLQYANLIFLCKQEKYELALVALSKLIEGGYPVDVLKIDPDLDLLREFSGFWEVVEPSKN